MIKRVSEEIVIPDESRDGFAFKCPDCGNRIRPPSGGRIWTCHEVYGGCGSKFKPIEAFKRIN